MLYCNEDSILRSCEMSPLTNRNPNGLSYNTGYSSRSAYSINCAAGNIKCALQPTPSVHGNSLQLNPIIFDLVIMEEVRPSSEVNIPIDLTNDTLPILSVTIPYATKKPSPATANSN